MAFNQTQLIYAIPVLHTAHRHHICCVVTHSSTQAQEVPGAIRYHNRMSDIVRKKERKHWLGIAGTSNHQ